MYRPKVYIAPDYFGIEPHHDNGGIRRVVDAQQKYLPQFGVDIVHTPSEADVIMNHGTTKVEYPGTPMISVSHGLMWSRYDWGDGGADINRDLTEAMCHADAHTAPSEWVANAIRRGGYWYPEVVHHGVEADMFKPGTNGGYVLWNKARTDPVSDEKAMQTVALIAKDIPFVSTFGKPASNVTITDVVPHAEMAKLVANAGVYLCTTRETFGIATLEAMACGVPVAGFDWGGQKEIIISGETGFLATPGDFNMLAEAIRLCIKHRDRMSKACVEDVRNRWGWERRIEQYARIIHRLYAEKTMPKPKVSVIVTAYKLDEYLPLCLQSISAQTFKDFECLVVDDAPLSSTRTLVTEYAKTDNRIKYIPVPENFGLPGARNYGAYHSKGEYIRHVDADDYLAPNDLAILVEGLDKDRGIHIAYTHLEVTNKDGSRRTNPKTGQPDRGGWPGQFDWYGQMSHLNQIPSCAMARREVFIKSGGYRERMKRQEDAEFWCRVTSLGYRAKKVSEAVTYFHRERNDSKGALEWKNEGGEPDWTAWFPWRMGAKDFTEARKIVQKYGNDHPAPHLVPFGAQGKPKGIHHWYVHDYAYPVVSVVVTCGPYHKKFLLDALDSIQAQTFPDWECIVVNDTFETWDEVYGAPWARVINMNGNCGASAARNKGMYEAKGKYVVFLDADDYWLPYFLERMVGMAEANPGGVIFSDLIMQEDEKVFKRYNYSEFDCKQVPNQFRYPGTSVLYPMEIIDAVKKSQGGWDTEIPGMEDWDFAVAVHDAGFCAYHIAEPLFVYRMYTSTKREADSRNIDEIRAYMDKKWAAYRKEGKKMGCGCAKKNPAVKSAMLTSSGNFTNSELLPKTMETESGAMVYVQYVGTMDKFSIRSRVDRNVTYTWQYGRANTVFKEDAEWLCSTTDLQGKPQYVRLQSESSEPLPNPAEVLGYAVA